jgi:hypothetical protein
LLAWNGPAQIPLPPAPPSHSVPEKTAHKVHNDMITARAHAKKHAAKVAAAAAPAKRKRAHLPEKIAQN